MHEHGCVITSETHGEQIAVDEQAKENAANKKATKETDFWLRHRPAVMEAEEALVAAGGTPSKLKGQEVLKALVISRTNRLPKAKNNNVEPGETEGARGSRRLGSPLLSTRRRYALRRQDRLRMRSSATARMAARQVVRQVARQVARWVAAVLP